MKYIVTMSSKGQIMLPAEERKRFSGKKLLLQTKGNVMILRPVKTVAGKDIDPEEDDLKDFYLLGQSAFNAIWDTPDDDIFNDFYSKES